MPRTCCKRAFLLNSRVPPQRAKIHVDSSKVFFRNKELESKMQSTVGSIQNSKLKKLAQDKHELRMATMSTTIDPAVVRSKSAVSFRGKHSERSGVVENVYPDGDSRYSSDYDWDSEDEGKYTSVMKKNRPYTSVPKPDNESSSQSKRPYTAAAALDEDISRTKAKFMQTCENMKARSFRHLRNLLSSDEITCSRYTQARNALMREKAKLDKINDANLRDRVKTFYEDLNTFTGKSNVEYEKPIKEQPTNDYMFII